LNDSSWRVRANAIFAICEVGNASVVKYLQPCLNDNNPVVRENAQVALERLQAMATD